MKKPLILVTTAFLIIIAVCMWWFSDTQVIKRQTQKLADSLTIAATDGKSSRLGKNQDFSSLLAPKVSCRVAITEYESDFSHDDLVSAHHMLAHNCETSAVEILNLELAVPEGGKATVRADLNLAVTEKGGRLHSEAAQAVLRWSENESGKWKLESIEITPR